ncbi:MAG: hypothetical protein F9K25_20165 [Candidatus Contendobacter sp.]|nr:MAG: hypothetical protein F9K25_20165 [Candidatus Contendobacter sp.]
MKRLMEDFFNVPGGLFLLLGWIALTVNAPYLGLPVAVVVIYWWSARRKARTASTLQPSATPPIAVEAFEVNAH